MNDIDTEITSGVDFDDGDGEGHQDVHEAVDDDGSGYGEVDADGDGDDTSFVDRDDTSDGDGDGDHTSQLDGYGDGDESEDGDENFMEDRITINGLADILNINMKNISTDDVGRFDFADLQVAYLFYRWYSRLNGFVTT